MYKKTTYFCFCIKIYSFFYFAKEGTEYSPNLQILNEILLVEWCLFRFHTAHKLFIEIVFSCLYMYV